jgi:signal peptidase I
LLIGIIVGGLVFPILGSGITAEYPFGLTLEKSSPFDWIPEEEISVKDDVVVIKIENARLSRYADTNSMDPVLDKNSNGIEVMVENPSQIHVGDIITYEKNGNLIVHRVVAIGTDEDGWYCVTKGDNNSSHDGKVRFEKIRYITIGIIY